jgi:hypothetical protein
MDNVRIAEGPLDLPGADEGSSGQRSTEDLKATLTGTHVERVSQVRSLQLGRVDELAEAQLALVHASERVITHLGDGCAALRQNFSVGCRRSDRGESQLALELAGIAFTKTGSGVAPSRLERSTRPWLASDDRPT